MSVVHWWSISADPENYSRTVSNAFRYVSVARRGISEPRERFENTEIATLKFEFRLSVRMWLAITAIYSETTITTQIVGLLATPTGVARPFIKC